MTQQRRLRSTKGQKMTQLRRRRGWWRHRLRRPQTSSELQSMKQPKNSEQRWSCQLPKSLQPKKAIRLTTKKSCQCLHTFRTEVDILYRRNPVQYHSSRTPNSKVQRKSWHKSVHQRGDRKRPGHMWEKTRPTTRCWMKILLRPAAKRKPLSCLPAAQSWQAMWMIRRHSASGCQQYQAGKRWT